MDERQTQIKEGEGLQESRVNEEFLGFLRKWSQPVLLMVVLVSLGWMAWNRYQEGQVAKRDAAFAALAANVDRADSPSPASLRAVSDEYAGVGSVALLADLRLADLYFESARLGLDIGAELSPTGDPVDDAAVLSAEDREGYLNDARRTYRAVLDAATAAEGRALIAANAAFGLAAVAESLGENDEAGRMYDKVIAIAEADGRAGRDIVARERKADLASLSSDGRIYALEELPMLPGETREDPDAEQAPEDQNADDADAGESETASDESDESVPASPAEPAATDDAAAPEAEQSEAEQSEAEPSEADSSEAEQSEAEQSEDG